MVQNYQGSVIALTDAGGNVQSSFKYGSYGEPKNANGQLSWTGSRFMYTGQVDGSKNGLSRAPSWAISACLIGAS